MKMLLPLSNRSLTVAGQAGIFEEGSASKIGNRSVL
jgi:hypothetical protein